MWIAILLSVYSVALFAMIIMMYSRRSPRELTAQVPPSPPKREVVPTVLMQNDRIYGKPDPTSFSNLQQERIDFMNQYTNIHTRFRKGRWKNVGIVINDESGKTFNLFRRSVDKPRNEWEYYIFDKIQDTKRILSQNKYLSDGDRVTVPGIGSLSVQLQEECYDIF